MLSYQVTVRNPSGLHLRPAGLLCGEAIKYKSSITFQHDGGTANAKSVLSVPVSYTHLDVYKRQGSAFSAKVTR